MKKIVFALVLLFVNVNFVFSEISGEPPAEGSSLEPTSAGTGCCGIKIKIGKCVAKPGVTIPVCEIPTNPKTRTSCRSGYTSLYHCQNNAPYQGEHGTCAFAGMGTPEYCEIHEVSGFNKDKECKQIPGSYPHRFECSPKSGTSVGSDSADLF